MHKICIIGNNRHGKPVADGGSVKVRLYKSFFEESGFCVSVVDLDGWSKNPFSLIHQIKRNIEQCETIIIMGGPKGCRTIIPLVNFLNCKKKKRVVFCPLGIGTVDKLLKNKNASVVNDFINAKNFHNIHDNRMKKQLKKIDLIIPQNGILCMLYKKFYELDNVSLIPNFRDSNIIEHNFNKRNEFKIIYASRVNKDKGIFDLMHVVNELIDNGIKVSLDIYGQLELNKSEFCLFHDLLSDFVSYRGVAKQNELTSIMSNYDLFVLPTSYYGEGTSGSLVDSMFAGTPALISSYSQSHHIINDGVNGLIYELGNNDDLKNKIIMCIENPLLMNKISFAAHEEAKKYSFKYNKEFFINSIVGVRP